jgi:acetyl-CoA acetyltransferase
VLLRACANMTDLARGLFGLVIKNHKYAVSNLYAQFHAGYSKADVLASSQITNELTKFMCSPTSVELRLIASD